MNLLSHLNRSVHHLQDCLHLSRNLSQLSQGAAGEGVVFTVALISVAAAAMLALA